MLDSDNLGVARPHALKTCTILMNVVLLSVILVNVLAPKNLQTNIQGTLTEGEGSVQFTSLY